MCNYPWRRLCVGVLLLAATGCTSKAHVATSGSLGSATFVGERRGGLGGSAVIATDLDGDGFADIVLGDGNVDHGEPQEGSVYVFYGRSERFRGSIPVHEADAILIGESRYAHAGEQLAAAGDVDGDGYGDLLVGAPHTMMSDGGSSAAYLVYGGPTRLAGTSRLSTVAVRFDPPADRASMGYRVAGGGDIDGDGLDDVLVSAPLDVGGAVDRIGNVYLLRGRRARYRGVLTVDELDLRITGGASLMVRLGASFAGDIDGDGYDEMLVEMEGSDPSSRIGAVALFYGGPGPWEGVLGPEQADLVIGETHPLWVTMGSAGDFDGDGLADIAVPSVSVTDIRFDVFYGRRHRLTGSLDAGDADFTVHPEDPASYLGAGLGVGDADGDGVSDLAIGDPHNPLGGGVQAGALYLLYGDHERRLGTLDLTAEDVVVRGRSGLTDRSPSSDLGYGVASGGDVDGDGEGGGVVAEVGPGALGRRDGRCSVELVGDRAHAAPPVPYC